MEPTPHPRLGVIFPPDQPPQRLRPLTVLAEDAGLDELWVWEDCFKESGIAAAAAALAWSERIRVGIGLLPVPLRNVAVTAMEIATLDRLFPGRLLAGIGHGVQDWMGQVGARVASPLTLLEEYAVALRRLLAGEEVTVQGRYVSLDRVRLDWPPLQPPPLLIGATGPRSLALAGRLADGVILAASTQEEVQSARDAVRNAREAAGVESGAADLVLFVEASSDARALADQVGRLGGLGITSVALQPAPQEADLEGFVTLAAQVRAML